MAKQYTNEETEPTMVNEDMIPYPHKVTIPIDLPTTGGYSIEYLKKELTDFAMKLLYRSKPAHSASRINWRNITVSSNVKAMSLGHSDLSNDIRDYKELLAEALEEKYR